MQYNYWKYSLLSGIFFLSIACFFSACNSKNSFAGKVVFTQLPINNLNDDQLAQMDWKYLPEMNIVMANMESTLENIEVLTKDFYSARAPEVNFDGESMVFSGQKDENDTWQIWTLKFNGLEFSQVTQSGKDCTDPTWLPDGRIAFSQLIEEENGLKYHALFTIGSDGCCEQRISFQPHEDLNASVMNDGRIIFTSRQVYPENGRTKYLVMRPDGTKAELFYLPEDNYGKSLSDAVEDDNGNVLFTNSGRLISIKFSHPLHSKYDLLQMNQGSVMSVFPMDQNQYLLSIKKPTEHSFGLSVFSLNGNESNDFYYSNAEFNLVEPVIIMQRELPKKLPTRVNMELESGHFFCMNSDNSDIDIDVQSGETAKIQVLGLDTILGETAVEEDGSFYVELEADQPVRFQTLNGAGEILRGPSSWMWIRPNERRGCTGCHADREIAPENVVPKAIEKQPVAMVK